MKTGFWSRERLRKNNKQGIYPICSNGKIGASHILRCEGTKIWSYKIVGKKLWILMEK
jgi:hypothetical protein